MLELILGGQQLDAVCPKKKIIGDLHYSHKSSTEVLCNIV